MGKKKKKKRAKRKPLPKDYGSFLKLWQAYPWPPTKRQSSGGYANECAIRMSIALEGVLPDFFDDYVEPSSPEGWARGAESLETPGTKILAPDPTGITVRGRWAPVFGLRPTWPGP